MKEEETQEEEKKETGSIVEVVTPPDEGELLLENRVFFGFQRIHEEDPKEEPIHIQNTLSLPPQSPPNFPTKAPQTEQSK